ncbi:MAG: isoprenylcysteine carboxylmethyltransferase family protein [Desulfobacter sp.]|jgi:protein-S-isoprenylcysteine O-methyltransferase Ste14|uniref:methyltransferase family protein n=1 Tax=uncultured Desulfobacter sp. TaxID=240139 RepID=UPI0029C9760B|nr:isoprenylcysteine carboxylmethyltransferase family protein [uncultured Desulfobacter sp.]MCW8800714.1 isoprenylcysteine carboxylmethyltransferase family protein [Desulfobacter sp.]
MLLNIEKYRILISRIVAVFVLFFILTTKSQWEINNEMFSFVLLFIGIVLVGIASLGRMWCSLYIAGYKDKQLITKGPYSICRNPLYFFSMVGVLGIGFCTETLIFPTLFILLFSCYYPFVIKSEENRLRALFGDVFEKYTRNVPAFFPDISIFEEPETYKVKPGVYRIHIFSALWFVWSVGILEVIEGFRKTGLIDALWTIY